MTKVSFDFDDTLDRGDVQAIAKQLSQQYELWIVTSRVPDEKAPSDNWNNDLWFVCKQLNIPKDRVVFTSYESKHEFFWDREDFLFHLDDDPDELHMITATCNVVAIDSFDPTWKEMIEELV